MGWELRCGGRYLVDSMENPLIEIPHMYSNHPDITRVKSLENDVNTP
jgi:hypothetical protein